MRKFDVSSIHFYTSKREKCTVRRKVYFSVSALMVSLWVKSECAKSFACFSDWRLGFFQLGNSTLKVWELGSSWRQSNYLLLWLWFDWQADVVAQTRIAFPGVELLQLIHSHLKAQGQTFFLYSRYFTKMSVVLRVFWPTALKLACITNLDITLSCWSSHVWPGSIQ